MGSVSALALLCCSALSLTRLMSYALDSQLTNPGVPPLGAALCGGALLRLWWIRGAEPHQPSADELSEPKELRPLGPLLLCLALGLYACSLLLAIQRFPLQSLSASHPQVVEGALLCVSVEGLGLWLLWWWWWCRQAPPWRARLTLPLLFGGFALPCEAWLRCWDEPLQRLGAELGAWLVTQVSQLGSLWGQPPIALSFWDLYTFRSEAFYLIIDESCSGVNLLLSSALYAVGFTWVTGGTPRAALWLSACALPLSLGLNGCRIAIIFLLGHYGGVELAMGPWHEGSAYLTQLPLVLALAYLSPKSQGKSGAQRS